MSFSIIWISDDQFKKYRKETLACIQREASAAAEQVQLLIYGAKEGWKKEVNAALGSDGAIKAEFFEMPEGSCYEEGGILHTDRPDLVYADATAHITSDWVTMLYDGDVLSQGSLSLVKKQAAEHENIGVMLQKKQPQIAFSGSRDLKNQHLYNHVKVTSTAEDPSLFPFFLGGTFIKADRFTKEAFADEAGCDSELRFFLDLCKSEKELLYLGTSEYQSREAYDGDLVFFRRLYHREFYYDSLKDFWIPYLSQLKAEGQIPEFIQLYLVFSLKNRFIANRNNKNKHVIEDEEQGFFDLVGEVLPFLEDRVILNERFLSEGKIGKDLMWLFGLFKHGSDYHFKMEKDSADGFYGEAGVRLGQIRELQCEIQTMDGNGGGLEIDGKVEAILYSMAEQIYFRYGDEKYPLVYNERYTLKKFFGVSMIKDHAFHMTIPKLRAEKTELVCIAVIEGKEYEIEFGYSSHFSRMSANFKNSYWAFRSGDKFLMTKKGAGLLIRKTSRPRVMLQEFFLFLNMLFCLDLRAKLFIVIRAAFFITRPFIKRRPIWMYLDKIYKGGDSSEYLYRYALAQNDGFAHYYLIDKNTSDYKRYVADGLKPLVRGTIMHRLVFLMADMMVISNSTVFSFNNFGQINSSYIRDLPDFHVCCVQHGMSVQKIAVAQNRLRDKTRLYFCASKYEIENLSRPVYDYEGYDALKLTGVPRYDGLKNRDQKQLLISPTWRMQSAVPVNGSEGYQRNYNPMFKETPYFKVYNSLINDERLIAAAKEYGYRIKYVLHPIVSAQGKDFTKNDYVDIIPSVGDMSYEKMFCESSLMVTDFSGVQFDFAYMRKPVVYLHHNSIPEHYEEGSFFYDTMGFGEICRDNDSLVTLLIEYMKDGCRMKEMYKQRADDFFYYDDDHNCERIYQEMLRYQEKVGITKGKD